MKTLQERIVSEGLTFDDVLLVPARSEVLPREVSLKARFSRNISLDIRYMLFVVENIGKATHLLSEMRFAANAESMLVFDIFGASARGGIDRIIALLDDEGFAGRWKEMTENGE